MLHCHVCSSILYQEMQPSSKARPNFEVTELKGKATQHHHTSRPLSLSINPSKIKVFLKKNAFLTLTLAAVALGKLIHNLLAQ